METEKSDADSSACLEADEAVPDGRANPRWSAGDRMRRASLISTLEGEIVPRLLMLSRSAGPARTSAGAASTATGPDDVEELARVLLAHCPDTAHEFVEAVRQRGVPYDRLCVGLLVPAAQRLAEQWERRELSYQQLSLGLNALRAVVLDVGGAAESN